MNKIHNTPKINTYKQLGMKNKYIYMKRRNEEFTMHYIYIIDSISNEEPLKYLTSKAFMLSIPHDKELKAYVYENIQYIQLLPNDTLYELTRNEWINIFREFVSLEGVQSKNISLNFDSY